MSMDHRLMCNNLENCAFTVVNNDFEIDGIAPLIEILKYDVHVKPVRHKIIQQTACERPRSG